MYAFKGVDPTQAARIISYMGDAGYPVKKIGATGTLVLGSPAILSAVAALATKELGRRAQS